MRSDRKYHVVFIPKYRWKAIYRELRLELAEPKESQIEEGHRVPDHVHMLISILPKYSVAQEVGFIKGESAIHLARNFGRRKDTNQPKSPSGISGQSRRACEFANSDSLCFRRDLNGHFYS
jgi:REP element-mobilizing transposase RayT